VNIDRTAGVIVFVSLVIDALSYHPKDYSDEWASRTDWAVSTTALNQLTILRRRRLVLVDEHRTKTRLGARCQ